LNVENQNLQSEKIKAEEKVLSLQKKAEEKTKAI